jgi:hypothetical protein
VTGEEGRQTLCHAARILEVQQVPSPGKNEWLDIWQPFEQQLVPLLETRIAPFPDRGEHRLPHAARLVWPEGPIPQGGQFVAEERIGVGQRLIDGIRNRVLQDGAVVQTAGPSEKRIDGCDRVTSAVQLKGLWNLRGARHRQQRRLEERDRLNDVRNVQRYLKRDATACGVPDDVCSFESEMTHQRAEAGRFPRERKRSDQ